MPELPEVETIRKQLLTKIKNKVISNIIALEHKQLHGDTSIAIGQTITTITRQGKVLTIHLSNDFFLNFHLKMSGQLIYTNNVNHSIYPVKIAKTQSNTLPGTTTRIIITFTDNSGIYFNDLRKFGWLKITRKPEGPTAVDILSPKFTAEYLQNVVKSSRKPIKVLLMDQTALAGIGNIYANDALWEAKIDPLRRANSLTDKEIKNLYLGILTVIKDGIEHQGSSSADEAYVLPNGQKGGYQHIRRVYHREGQPCLRDKTLIKRIKQAGRSTFFCPLCQI